MRQKVARTSAAPGKTRLANFYRVRREGAPAFYLVDLPGYGYARGGDDVAAGVRGDHRERTSAGAPVRTRRSGRSLLAGVLLLVDSRHPGLEADRLAWDWLQAQPPSRVVIATKVDKLTRSDRVRNVRELEQLHNGPVLGVSAQTGEGLKDLWKTIDALLRPETAAKDPTR